MRPINTILKSTHKLRAYVRTVQRSREELADSISEENVRPPIPPSDRKHPK
jgi:hypothetical protein